MVSIPVIKSWCISQPDSRVISATKGKNMPPAKPCGTEYLTPMGYDMAAAGPVPECIIARAAYKEASASLQRGSNAFSSDIACSKLVHASAKPSLQKNGLDCLLF